MLQETASSSDHGCREKSCWVTVPATCRFHRLATGAWRVNKKGPLRRGPGLWFGIWSRTDPRLHRAPLSLDFLVCEVCLARKSSLLEISGMSRGRMSLRIAVSGNRHKIISFLKTTWMLLPCFVCFCKLLVIGFVDDRTMLKW